jgi:outer membrane protein TolC
MSVTNVDMQSIQSAVTNTLAQATNLIITRKNLQVSELNLEVTKGALLPNLSMNGGYSASGQGGTQHVNGVVIPAWSDAWASRRFSPQWNLGSISYPIGRLQKSRARRRDSDRQDVARLKSRLLI